MFSNPDKVFRQILARRELNTVEPGVLTVGGYLNFYPVAFKKNDVIKGLDIELLSEFARMSGLKLKIVEIDKWNGIWDLPSKRICDVSCGGIGISDARTRAKTQFTIPYFYVKRTLIYNKKHPIRSFKDIDGQVRGTVGSTGWEDAKQKLKATGKLSFLKPGHSDEEDLKDLLSLKVVALMRGDLVGVSLCRRFKELAMMDVWEMDPKMISSDGECFAYPCHKDSGLAVTLSSFITALLLSGQLQKLVTKYKLE